MHNLGLSVVNGVAMILNLITAALSDVAVPLMLKRMGLDPALSGAVVLTKVTGIVGFLIFLGLASWFLLLLHHRIAFSRRCAIDKYLRML